MSKRTERARAKMRAVLKKKKLEPIRSRFDLSDAVQEGMLQLANRSDESMITDTDWLATIGTGHFYKFQRLNLAKKRSVVNEEPRQLDSVPSCSEENLLSEYAHELIQCLEKLDKDIRHAVIRREYDEASYSEIAAELNISEYGAKEFHSEGVQTLRKLMGIEIDE